MSGSSDAPADGDGGVRDTWETGLRRRRRGRQGDSAGSEDDGDGNDEPTPARRRSSNSNGRDGGGNRVMQNNSSSRDTMNSNTGPSSSGGGFLPGLGAAAGPCGGGVGVLTSPAGATATFGGGPSTPYKTPTKDNGLVAVTPNSVATAGTAESTVLSHSPLVTPRRRSRRGQLASASAPSLRRQYQLLRSQILLLMGSAVMGLVLFLFYALPLAAFISLALMASSMGALLPLAGSFVRARYEMEMEHPLGLTRYLPDSLRVMLTETTMHEFMTDTTFVMENRYLLLYFMPGLQPEQLMAFIDRLPPRHREALLQPGLGRMMPSVMRHLMRMDNNAGGGAVNNADGTPLLENGDGSVASGLTADREHQGENDEIGEVDDAEVTLLEAVTGLRRTLAGFALGEGAGGDRPLEPLLETPEGPPLAAQMPEPPAPIANAAPANEDRAVVQDDDNSSFDFSFDLDGQGLTDMVADADEAPAVEVAAAREPPTDNAELRNVIVEMPQPPDQGANQQQPDDQNQEEVQQREYDLEGRILSEAASAAAANYASQAAAIAGGTAAEAMDGTTSWLVRAGSLTGLIAGGGGIVAAVLANPRLVGPNFPRSITLGIVGLASNAGSAGSSSGGAGRSGSATGGASDGQGRYPSFVYGLFATSAFGFIGAGAAYLARNRVRASIAANRERRLKDEAEAKDKPSPRSE